MRAAAEVWDQEDQTIGFLARLFAQTSLPYRDPGDVAMWGRRNGNLSLVVQPGMVVERDGTGRSLGYPFGTIPRLLLTWMSTEAVRTKSPELALGASLADFMRALDLQPSGGRNGSVGRLRTQMERLFQATLSVRWDGDASRESGGRPFTVESGTAHRLRERVSRSGIVRSPGPTYDPAFDQDLFQSSLGESSMR